MSRGIHSEIRSVIHQFCLIGRKKAQGVHERINIWENNNCRENDSFMDSLHKLEMKEPLPLIRKKNIQYRGEIPQHCIKQDFQEIRCVSPEIFADQHEFNRQVLARLTASLYLPQDR